MGCPPERSRSPAPTFVDGATIRVETTGGADVPALTATITAPPEVRGFDLPAALSRSGDTVTWTPHEGTAIEILVGAMSSRTRDGAYLLCRAPDAGAFTIPASTFALVPPAFDRAIVLVSRVAASTQLAGDASVSVEARTEANSQVIPLLPAAAVVITPSDTTPRRILDPVRAPKEPVEGDDPAGLVPRSLSCVYLTALVGADERDRRRLLRPTSRRQRRRWPASHSACTRSRDAIGHMAWSFASSSCTTMD